MFSKLVLGLFSVFLLLNVNQAFAEDESPIITIDFVSGNTIDLDEGPQMIRAEIQIQNYNPQDGFHFMQVIRLNDGEILKDTEILPKQIDDDLFSVQILHYLDPDDTEIQLGDYGLRIYSEFGTGDAISTFSVIKSSLPENISQNIEETEITTMDIESLTDQLENFCFMSDEEQSNFFSEHFELADFEESLSFICDIENVNQRQDSLDDFIFDLIDVSEESPIETLTEESPIETLTEESPIETLTEESKIPTWVHDIFVWYADEVISEDELLSALEYLISEGVLDVDSP